MMDLVLIHEYLETGFKSVVAFSNSFDQLECIMHSNPRFGSNHHNFLICVNFPCNFLNGLIKVTKNDHLFSYDTTDTCSLKDIKDSALLNICKNVAEYLSVGEYSLLKNSYFKSSAWFDMAKHSAFIGADIINNY